MHMAKKDSLTELAELNYIKWAAKKLEISEEELIDIAEGEKGFSSPYSTEERLSLLYELMRSFYHEKQIDKSEMPLCTELAIKMEIKIKSVDKLLRMIKKNDQKLIDYEAFQTICS